MKIKNLIALTLISISGAVFIISALTKLFPVEPLEFKFVETGFIPWDVAPFLARLLIGFEFFLGLLLLVNLYLKNFTYRLTMLVLVVFSIFLIIQLFSGNNENCGCFGEFIKMTPSQALIKNIIMLIIIFFCSTYWNGWNFTKLNDKLIKLFLVITTASIPFIINTIELNYSQAYLNRPADFFELPLDTLYQNAQIGNPSKTLSKGKHVFAFLSLTCPHCKIAAKKIGLINKRNSKIHFYMIMNGKTADLQPFLKNSKTENIDHALLSGKSFIYMAGIQVPILFLVNNGVVEHFLSYQELDQSQIEKWIETKKR
jgi:hypothetical protein